MINIILFSLCDW